MSDTKHTPTPRQIYIRDPLGKPVKATLLRMLRIKKGFHNVGLVQTESGRFSVSELRSGAAVGHWGFDEKSAIWEAKQRIAERSPEEFQAGIEAVVSTFGELPALEEAQ